MPLAAGELDSEDERANDFFGKNYPTQRPKRACLEYFKDIDMHGVSPTLVAQGQTKFKTWWGASFYGSPIYSAHNSKPARDQFELLEPSDAFEIFTREGRR